MPKNNSKNETDFLVALDVGTSKIVCLIGQVIDSHSIEVISMGSYPSSGLKKGVVVNIDATTDAIQKSVDQAVSSFDGKIKNVYVGIAGQHIKSLNSHGIVRIENKEVTSKDIDGVIDMAQDVSIPSDQMLLHVLPKEFYIDDLDSIREPLGMSGAKLGAHVHLVTCAVTAMQNIEKCVRRSGLNIDGFVLEQLASSYSVLSDDEKELGVCLVDIGGGTTDIAIFNNGSITFTGVIPIAGDQVTSDIAVALRTPTPQAEDIKQKYGCAVSDFTQDDEVIAVPGVGGRPPRDLSRRSLADIIEPRYVELFELVKAEIERNGFESKIPAGIVLTGGTSQIEGAVELAESIFQTSVRLGSPENFTGMESILKNPIYATSLGLLGYGFDRLKQGYSLEQNTTLFQRAFGWLRNNY
ncbi:MAG: cell division protein FtsA [Gammaproteobacteria bacterium]|jgi:cell division protein FtsA